MDENGAISLQGRHADAVRFKVSAEVVYPGPIEVVLCGIPAIRAAQVSGLFGHTNITWTHTPRNAAQQQPYLFSTLAKLHYNNILLCKETMKCSKHRQRANVHSSKAEPLPNHLVKIIIETSSQLRPQLFQSQSEIHTCWLLSDCFTNNLSYISCFWLFFLASILL